MVSHSEVEGMRCSGPMAPMAHFGLANLISLVVLFLVLRLRGVI